MKQARGEDYSSEAFSQTNPYQSQIADIAAKLELRPEAIYGAMVEENHGYRQGFLKNWLGDGWTLSHALTHDFMVADYRRAQQAGKLDRHSTWDKINPVLNDIGPFNFKLATAMRLLQNYLDTTPADSDPLELRRYAGNYPQLATDLAAGDAVPEFAGLMLAEAKRYMRAHADPEYWAQLSDAEKDALYLTYYNMGPVTIEERRPKNTLLNQGKYKPAPGLKDAAGKNHQHNATQIGQKFGHANYRTPDAPTETPPATPAPLPQTPRASPHDLVSQLDDASIILRPGATLADIVARERLRGNPITLGDLRAVNGLRAGQEWRLADDYLLLLPKREHEQLTVDDTQARLSFNPGNGSYSLSVLNDDGAESRCARRWDSALQRYIDDYEISTASGARHQRQFTVDMGYGERLNAAYQPFDCQALPVVSSNIATIGYHAASQTLSVLFRKGSRYEYYNVPRACFEAFLAATSKGQYLNFWIKGIYPYARIGPSPYRRPN